MVTVTGAALTLDAVVMVARHGEPVELGPGVRERLAATRAIVDRVVAAGVPAYGVNTGFGALCDTAVPLEELRRLQENLVRSHAAAVGAPFPEEVVRAAILLRLNSLCRGHSGVRPAVVETLAEMLNRGVHPVVPAQGSLGASGDLAPLAHLALVMIGEGKARWGGEVWSGGEALRKAGLSPLRLEAKEGLALLNGTAFLTAVGALACWDGMRTLEIADGAAVLSLEALGGAGDAYRSDLIGVRPHQGAVLVGEHLRALLAGGSNNSRLRRKIQDPYSFRCVPQVHGAVLDALLHASRVLEVELNSTTDNPLILDDTVVSGGNFHGQPVGAVMDYVGIVLAALSGISERRIDHLLNPVLSGLPAFLVPDPGLNSGWMIAQYTAASLVNENRTLASPASVHSLPVCADQEDYVSMATLAARQAREIVANTQAVLAIELLVGAQAVEMRLKEDSLTYRELGVGARVLYEAVRAAVPYLERDRYLHPDLVAVLDLVRDGTLCRLLREQVGPLPV